jgi:putative ABC transport system permease protein
MVRPTGIGEFYQIHQEINQGRDAQAVLSGQGMTDLFDLLGQGRAILGMVSYLALVMGAATVFMAAYAAGVQRKRDTAVLRALGAGRWVVSGIALAESLAMAGLGAVLGLALGHAAAWLVSSRIQDASAIAVRPTFVESELVVAAAVFLLAAAAGLLPAFQSYRQDVAANLAPV